MREQQAVGAVRARQAVRELHAWECVWEPLIRGDGEGGGEGDGRAVGEISELSRALYAPKVGVGAVDAGD